MLRHLRYVPSCPELRKSLKLRSKEYLRENTLAGFPYFVNPNRPTWERAIWLICTIASLIGALVIIAIIWERFQTSPTITGIDIQTDELTINLPSLVLCMTSDYLELSQVSKDLTDVYQKFYNWNWEPLNVTLPKLTQTLSDVFLQRTPSCSNVVGDCIDRGNLVPCKNIFHKILTPAGICCRSAALPLIKDQPNMNLSFALLHQKKLNIYFQELEDDIPLRDTPITYRPVENTTFDIIIEITEASDGLRMLTKSQRACVFSDEGPTYNKCVFKCMQDTFRSICKCLPWFYSKSKLDQCTLEQYSCLSTNVVKLRKPKCISKCYIHCAHITYGFENIKSSPVTAVRTKWPQVKYEREVRFGWLDLIVSFGGIMGLFLGYSILTTFEMIYYFTLRLYCGAIIDNEDKVIEKIKLEDDKKKIEIHISLELSTRI
ncbi:pickpocket protein 11-like [Chelonus insularis]|uniref:pickpocket protein 11-like n=1 Tax=Chelonus insularis TaxID=460826 RepID=UPI00158E5D1F|nr:pickpocket protein 11-like [Chelonus insularis]